MTRNPTLPMHTTDVLRHVFSTRLLSPLPEGYRLHPLPEHVRACDGHQAQVTLSPPLQRGYHRWGIVSSVYPSGTSIQQVRAGLTDRSDDLAVPNLAW